jgi:hypothetical protein
MRCTCPSGSTVSCKSRRERKEGAVGGRGGRDREREKGHGNRRIGMMFPRKTDKKGMEGYLEKTGNRPVEKTAACPSPLPLCSCSSSVNIIWHQAASSWSSTVVDFLHI